VDAPDNAYPDGQVAASAVAALDDIAKAHRQPFFLAVGFRKPHLPFSAPRKFWDLYDSVRLPSLKQLDPLHDAPPMAFYDSVELRGYTDMPKKGAFTTEEIVRLRRAYYAAMSFSDAQVGRVMAALQRTGLDRNTIIVLWSDNGYHLGELGMWTKSTNYETATRVPLIIAAPDQRRRGTRVSALVELLDLYPTLVHLCGLPPAQGIEGQNIAVFLDQPDHMGRAAVFSQFPRPWPYDKAFSVMGYAVRSERFRYVEWRRAGTGEIVARELYRYADGPRFETKNLADEPKYASEVKALAALLPQNMAGLPIQH
jgi:arylsulfatase A-like enzyme